MSGGVEALYPFLYGGGGTTATTLLDEVRASTVAKVAEVSDLRAGLASAAETLAACAEAMAARFADGGRLFCFGNGGSSTDAQSVAHLFSDPPAGARGLPAVALTDDIATVTALANDVGVQLVFSRQLAVLARPADMAFGLSTSGGSANVLDAFAEARRAALLTIGFAGYDGGAMAEAQDIDHLVVVPSSSVHRIQEAQTTAYHVLWELVQHALRSSPEP